MLTANWLDWYQARHNNTWSQSTGLSFEKYVNDVLSKFHDDFIKPAAVGRFGDAGCDGIAESGRIFYACYGHRPGRNVEREVTKKLESDFFRARDSWKHFRTWRFLTNAQCGPLVVGRLTELQQDHGPESERRLTLRIWNSQKFWDDIVSKLPGSDLDHLFPGVPGIAHLDLADVLPLLEALATSDVVVDHKRSIQPVPASKMDFNSLAESSRMEFNDGRVMAPRIDRWYAEAANPALYDTCGEKFKKIYAEARNVTTVPSEILERLYVAVAGPEFRMDAKRSRAAYAVVSYYFDSCHIFESQTEKQGERDATSH